MFNDFKPVLKILLRFILIYVALVLLYQLYLKWFENKGLDLISGSVAMQTGRLLQFCNFPTTLVEGTPQQQTTWFFISGKYVSRMVEGCNAVSVMIMFLAFIFAFYKGAKTFIFAAAAILLLHFINVLRIAGLNIVLLKYPQYGKIAHDYAFPAVIYGSVVLLWLVWIKYFALKNPENEAA